VKDNIDPLKMMAIVTKNSKKKKRTLKQIEKQRREAKRFYNPKTKLSLFTPNKPLRKRYRGINLSCNEENEILNARSGAFESNIKSASTAADENLGSDGSQEFKAVESFTAVTNVPNQVQ
jgi:glucose dehydrogenase